MSDTTTKAYAALEVNAKKLEQIEIDLLPLTDEGVEIKVECCGLCGSDEHLIKGDYGEYAVFPQVCGHEVVGTVRQIGKKRERRKSWSKSRSRLAIGVVPLVRVVH